MNDKNTDLKAQRAQTQAVQRDAAKASQQALLAEAGSEGDPFADGSTAVYTPGQQVAAPQNAPAGAAAGGVDPFADPGAAETPATVTAATAEAVPNPEETQGLFGGVLGKVAGLAPGLDGGMFSAAAIPLAAVGGSDKRSMAADEDASGGNLDIENLQSGVSTLAFGLDRGAANTPIEGPAGVVAQVLLNVVPGGDDSNDVVNGRDPYPGILSVFGPGQEQAEQGFNDTVGSILTTEFNDQLTADLLPIAQAIGSIAAEQPFIVAPD